MTPIKFEGSGLVKAKKESVGLQPTILDSDKKGKGELKEEQIAKKKSASDSRKRTLEDNIRQQRASNKLHYCTSDGCDFSAILKRNLDDHMSNGRHWYNTGKDRTKNQLSKKKNGVQFYSASLKSDLPGQLETRLPL